MTKKLQQAFWNYHGQHPEFYEKFDEVCHQLIKRGYDRFAGIMIMGIVVWMHSEETGQKFSISTGLAAYYVRYWQKKNPDYAHFFHLGKLKDT